MIPRLAEYLTEEDQITLAMIKKAREGDTQAYSKLMDSLYGTPQQSVNLSTEEREPLVHVIVCRPEDLISDPIE
jgi:hypothetical protein